MSDVNQKKTVPLTEWLKRPFNGRTSNKLKRLPGGLVRRWYRLQKATFEQEFLLAGKIGACDISDTIVVVGSPRSGTTWLLEILRLLPKYKAINEPLNRKKVRQNHGFYERTYIHPDQSAPKQRECLLKVLTGQVEPFPLYRWSFREKTDMRQIIEHATHNKLVVKFCRINRMIHWFDATFDVRGIVFIVRHPCAVVNSMLRYGQWEQASVQQRHEEDSALYINHLPESVQKVFHPILDRISTHAEVLATLWCLDQHLSLVHHNSYPWILVPYERLLLHGREELKRIATALGVELNPDMIGKLHEPSSSVKGQLDQKAKRQLSKWKRRLSTCQINDILRVVDDAGLSSIYTDSIEPDYDRLNNLQKSEWAWRPKSEMGSVIPAETEDSLG